MLPTVFFLQKTVCHYLAPYYDMITSHLIAM